MWRRVALVLAAVVVVAAAGVGGWMAWRAGDDETEPEPVAAATPPVIMDAAAVEEERPVEISDAAAEEKVTQDAGNRTQDTGHRKSKKTPVSIPEPEPRPVAVDAGAKATTEVVPPADARLTVEMDTWCDLAIDGGASGRLTKSKTVVVRPGRRAVTCTNKELGTWRESVELAPGEKKTVKGSLVPEIAVRVSIGRGDAVLIDKVRVGNGGSRKLKRGSHRVDVVRLGKVVDSALVTVMGACTLVDRPAIACR
jgi:hypothetical protein